MLSSLLSLFAIWKFSEEWGTTILIIGGVLIAVLIGVLVFMRMRKPED